MAFDYSASNLIASVRDITGAGSSTQDWPDTQLLRLLNREIDAYLVPFIVEARKEHFDTFTDTPLIANQQSYYLPSKAMGGKLRAAQLVDGTGAPYAPLIEAPLEEAIGYGSNVLTGTASTGVPSRYWFRGNQLVLFPTPSGSPALSLRLYHPNRPSTLVANTSCVQTTTASAGSGNFTVNFTGTIPAGFSNSTVVDLVQNKPGFDVLFTGPIASQTASSFTITGTLPAQLVAGDWVCLSDTAPVVTGAVPDIVVGCLVKKVALEIMAVKGDDQAFSRIRSLLASDEKRARVFLRRRNEGNHAKVGANALNRFRGRGSGW